MTTLIARRLFFAALIAAAFLQIHTAGAQTYPRLGAYLIGGNTTPLTPAHVAKLGVLVLGAYPGWVSKAGLKPQAFAAAAKAINPNMKVFIYANPVDAKDPPGSGLGLIASAPWYLYTDKTSGTKVAADDDPGFYMVNITTYSKVYDGVNYPTWRARYDVSQFITPNTSVDGLYTDNSGSTPGVSGDWTLSGSSQAPNNATAQKNYELGFVAYVKAARAASSSHQQLIMGNLSNWYQNGFGRATITSYQGVYNGGTMEGIIGESWSTESWGGWATMMAAYTTTMNALAAPQLGVFYQYDTSAADYQNFRYGFASCLMGNGYYFYDLESDLNNDYVTFDEFNANLGTATTAALVFPGAKPYQKGVYRRDFQNGIALVNPKGNGTQTVTLGGSFKHLSGTQDPSINDGKTVTSVTLNERDGVILLRTTAAGAAVPESPSLSVH